MTDPRPERDAELPAPDPGGAPPRGVDGAWRRLREHLARRSADLIDEVRRYPTPIARCDEQLPKLLEQRSHAVREARRAREADAAIAAAPLAERCSRVARFLEASRPAPGDEAEAALRDELARAIGEARQPPYGEDRCRTWKR